MSLRLRPASSTSSSSIMSLLASSAAVPFLILFVMNVLVGVSDSASVPISGGAQDEDSLASSRILSDDTSSSSTPTATTQFKKSLSVPLIRRQQERTNANSNGIIGNGNRIDVDVDGLPKEAKIGSLNSYEMSSSSPLHVARCRATCLEKFKPQEKVVVGLSSTASSFTAPMDLTTTSADDMHLLPILRLRKKRAAQDLLQKIKKSSTLPRPWSCSSDSTSDCLSCWKSCELLETGSPQFKGTPITSASQNKELPCALMQESKECLDGCQVACSFYKHIILSTNVEQQSSTKTTFTSDPVVATKQENVVRIVPGKITWPLGAPEGNKKAPLSSSPSSVVYAVIQEYPDRKWRQIAQTTETELEIPKELTSAMKTKLRSVRVLVVGPEGLLSVLSPKKQVEQLSDNNNNSQDKVESSEANSLGINVTHEPEQEKQTESEMAVTISDSGLDLDGNNNDDHHHPHLKSVAAVKTSSDIGSTAPDSLVTNSSSGITVITFPTEEVDNLSGGVEGEPFQLRRVSLIHQKSLVIAELQWNGIGNNPSQEYLITWELTGGGLKGHLVTDSTSVTLSLWPDTTYQIQVELFEQNLDVDGEQPAVESSSVSLKSLPLTVDTSEASFPLENPSALLGNNDEEEEDEEDESSQEGNEREEGEEEDTAHKSITGFLNMSLVLGISVTALILVLVILTLAAFTWTRTRSFSSSKVGCLSGKGGKCCYKGCFSDFNEPELLLSQDDLIVEDTTNTFGNVVQQKSQRDKKNCSWKQNSFFTSQDKRDGQESGAVSSVAVISSGSSSSEAPFSYLNYYCHNGLQTAPFSSSGKVAASSSSNTGAREGVIKTGEQGCPSLSSCWLPDATYTAVPVTTSSFSSRGITRGGSGSEAAKNLQQIQQAQQQQYLHRNINNSSMQ